MRLLIPTLNTVNIIGSRSESGSIPYALAHIPGGYRRSRHVDVSRDERRGRHTGTSQPRIYYRTVRRLYGDDRDNWGHRLNSMVAIPIARHAPPTGPYS